MPSNPRLVEALDDTNSGGECRRNNAVLDQTSRQLVFYNHSRTTAIKHKSTHYPARPLRSTSMAEIASIYDGPPELVDCIKDHCSHYTLPSCGILKLVKCFSKVMSGAGIFHYPLAVGQYFSISTVCAIIINKLDIL